MLARFNRQAESPIDLHCHRAEGAIKWTASFAPDPEMPPWHRLDHGGLCKSDLERGRLEWHSAYTLLTAQGFTVSHDISADRARVEITFPLS